MPFSPLPLADVSGAIGAVTAAIISAFIAVVAMGWNLYLQNRAAYWKREADAALEERKSQLTQEGVRAKARIDYEHEALQRLYLVVEPLLFQMVDQSEAAMHRIASLARSARLGKLDPKVGWLSDDGYYLRSTVYQLLAPLATLRLIQRKLTVVDLSLDPWVDAQYRLAKQVYISFTDDFQFARGGTSEEEGMVADRGLTYDPHVDNWRERRLEYPPVYWRQGLPIGVLDQVIDAFAVADGDAVRVVNYGEFDSMLSQKDFGGRMELAFDVFKGFAPNSRPVLWRMFVAQYFLHKTIVSIGGMRHQSNGSPKVETSVEEIDRSRLRTETGDDTLEVALEIAAVYLQRRKVNLNATTPTPHPEHQLPA